MNARRLAGKVAIVTGAGSGIGRAIAELFALHGARVVVAEIEADNGRAVVDAIRAAGGDAVSVLTDVARADQCLAMAEAAVRQFGRIDVLINNAAAFVFGTVEQATPEAWSTVLGVNVVGAAQCVAAVLPVMRQAGGGAIVNIASVSGFIAQPAFVPYNTSKGALLQLTRCLAMDLAADKIRVNAICPGAIRTRATDRHIQSLGLDAEQAYRDFGNDALMRRMGQPIEVAYGALFLASDEASFITGTHLTIDGGATID
jgi:NAD(P)-dependent dehydrogenase (short-subunit alcohol dehydrogenase family)